MMMMTDPISDAFILSHIMLGIFLKNFPCFYICYLREGGQVLKYHCMTVEVRGQRSASRSQFSPSICGYQRPDKGMTVGTFTY